MSILLKAQSEHRQVLKSSSYDRSTTLPFGHLNLRFNPFGELPQDIRAHLAVVDVDKIVEQLRNPHFAVQFIGDQGRGKTTHLLAIRSRIPDARYVYIDEYKHPPIPDVKPGGVFMIDEAQRLNWLERRIAFRKHAALVIGTHDDLTKPLTKSGYEVTTVQVAELCTPEHLFECFNRRIRYARRYPGPIPYFSFQTATRLFMRYGNDIRTMEGHLYDAFQNLTEVGDV